MSSLSSKIKQHAHQLGFNGIKIIPISAALTHPFYQQWLNDGYAADMHYLHRHEPLKQDPRKLLPTAKSMLCVSLPYNHHSNPAPDNGLYGRISRYALGTDYHITIKQHLTELATFIAEQSSSSFEQLIATDSMPIMEREFAARAGLGWVGKHGIVINRHHGSWNFLGELLISLELDEYDQPSTGRSRPRYGLNLPEHCGSCRRCIDACPTGAIVSAKTVDSNLCLSYLTIESRQPIPQQLQKAVGNWLFGCDICQEVCPWNQKLTARLAQKDTQQATQQSIQPAMEQSLEKSVEQSMASAMEPAIMPSLQKSSAADQSHTENPPKHSLYLDLEELINLDQHGFSQRFKNSPLKRAKRSGIIRNALIILSNHLNAHNKHHYPRLIKRIRQLVDDHEPLICSAALSVLIKCEKPDLSEATLSKHNLSKSDLSKSDLSKHDLSKHDLSKNDSSKLDLPKDY